MENRKLFNVVTIGYAKRALEAGTRDRERMLKYASVVKELHIIVFTRKSDGYPSVQQEGNLFLYATNARTKIGMLWRAFEIGLSIVTNDKKWIVSCQDPFETSLIGSLIARRNNVVHHIQIHGDHFNPHSYKVSLLQRLRVLYGRYIVRHVDGVRVVSDRIKKSIVKFGVSPEIITILPVQGNLAPFIEVGKVREYDANKPVKFLYVGRFSPEKNLPLLIKSFRNVVADFSDTTLTLLGDGPQKQQLVDLISELNLDKRVNFISWTDNVPAVVSAHDVLCLSSNHEGWAMVLLEAAATGIPVVTTSVGCTGECIVHDEHGQVTPVQDEKEYTKALRVYLENKSLIETHGRAGFQLVQSQILSEEEYLDKMVESWSSCVN